MSTLVVATANVHKLVEIARLLAVGGLDLELVPMSALGVPSPVEDGDTFVANARIKARACVAATGLPAIADDSGITVEALGDAPGVHSARFAGEDADDGANNRLLLERLVAARADRPELRRAAFVCAAAFVLPDGTEHVTEGRMAGRVTDAPRGGHGFGYDPLFVADATPDGRTNGELQPDEKDAISHRAVAFAALRPVIVDRFSPGWSPARLP